MQMAFIEDSIYPTWTKNLDLDSQLRFDDFPLAQQFKHVANIISTPANSKRQTVITFDPTISKVEWNEVNEIVYIFTVDGRIVKIGGSFTSLLGRCGSYLCGHHIRERGKSGDCSKTNGFIYQTFDHYARNGHIIKMYAFKIPPVKVKVDIWGSHTEVVAQVYPKYETAAMETYKKITGAYPILCDNCDPTARRE
jgi:hypothetical protein